jgi:uncharacterized protein
MNLSRLFRHFALAGAFAACTALAQPADTPIFVIQGSGATSPLVGQAVSTTGVVTRLNNNGFFIQDATGDGDPATSDGVFVFTGNNSPLRPVPGSLVRLSGTVAEFNVGAAGNAYTAARPMTQLTNVGNLTVLGTGFTIEPKPLVVPKASRDDFERYEGMLVRLQTADGTPLTVQQNFFQARFGQLTLGAGGRHETPTNRHRPGPEAQALNEAQFGSRILLDDGSSLQNPNPTPYAGPNGVPRAGDTLDAVVGVIDFGLATSSNQGLGLYRIHPTVAPVITVANPRPAAPEPVGGNLSVAALNVLNFFTTFTNGQTADGQTGQGCSLGASVTAGNCRGASNLPEFLRQRDKLVLALAGLDADIVGLIEVQNNGLVAVNNLVAALNAHLGGPVYTAVPPPATGTGTDAIQQALIYKPARVERLGASLSDTAAVHNRPPVAQTFVAPNGERLSVIVSHHKSKGSCPSASSPDAPGNVDAGDGQGCWNLQRTEQSQALAAFAAQLKTASGSTDVALVGDFNAYGQEDPIFVFTGQGWVDALGRFNSSAYTYVFDGMSGRLDHTLLSPSLAAKLAGATAWAINADESVAQDYNLEFKQPACATCAPDPYDGSVPARASDHDPTLAGLHIYKRIVGTPGRDVITGTPGDDIIIGGGGADEIRGNGGRDLFTYTSMRDAGDLILDFEPGDDRIDLRTLLATLGWTGTDPVAEGWVRLLVARTGLQIQVDVDGPTGSTPPRTLLTLAGVGPGQFVPARDLIAR